tara:strand:- start:132 stop:1007 length:876 start_codon:yes stop_codon:yes gene_type:complete
MVNPIKVKKAVVPVAGLGTRMLPATKAIPKEMLPIVTKPIIQYIVEEISLSGIDEIILVTHASKTSIENHFDKSFELEATLEKRVKRYLVKEIKSISKINTKILSIRQGHALGLGHAILCAKPLIRNEPFAVILPDMIIKSHDKSSNLLKLKKEFERTNKSQILLGHAKKEDIHKYGIAKINKNNIVSISEKPTISKAPSNLFVVGRYILNNEVLNFLEKTQSDKSGEVQLTDALNSYLKADYEIKFSNISGEIFDCGEKLGYLKAIVKYGLEDIFIKKEFRKFIKETLIN